MYLQLLLILPGRLEKLLHYYKLQWVCIYEIPHNRAIRSCDPSHSMPLAFDTSKGGSKESCVCVLSSVSSESWITIAYSIISNQDCNWSAGQ